MLIDSRDGCAGVFGEEFELPPQEIKVDETQRVAKRKRSNDAFQHAFSPGRGSTKPRQSAKNVEVYVGTFPPSMARRG